MKKLCTIVLIINLFMTQTTLASGEAFYIVKKGDSLSKILQNYSFTPIYGANGSLNEISSLNNIKNKNLIYPNQIIYFKKEKLDTAPQSKLVVAKEQKEDCSKDSSAAISKSRDFYSVISLNAKTSTYEVHGHENVNNTDGYLNSASAFGFDLNWAQNWNSKFQTHLGVSQDFVKFNSFADGRDLRNSDINMLGVFLGASYQVANPLKVSLILGNEDQIGYVATTPTAFSVIKGSTPTASIGADLSLYQVENLEIILAGQYKYISSFSAESVKFDSGRGYSGEIKLKQKLGKVNLLGTGFFKNNYIENSQANFETKNVGFKLGLELTLK